MQWTFEPAETSLSEPQRVVTRWARAELQPWIARDLNRERIEAEYDRLNSEVSTIFIFRLDASGARILPKRPFGASDRREDQPGYHRAELYRKFFGSFFNGQVCESIDIAIDVDDQCPNWPHVPVFTFQKSKGSRNILLPDIDFIASNFYESAEFWGIPDRLNYNCKQRKAVFVGSTTGVRIITKEHIIKNSVPRIRAARYFKEIGNVIFRLTNIVQTESQYEYAMLAEEGLGGDHVGWAEQLDNKFVVSIDGNGAACSRLFIGLASNSCLLKYTSDYVLYYFKGLKEWMHFVPIDKDSDICHELYREEFHSEVFEKIAKKGQMFAQTYLTEEIIIFYTMQTLSAFKSLFYR